MDFEFDHRPRSILDRRPRGHALRFGGRAGTADYSAIAALGINLNQANGDPAPRSLGLAPLDLGRNRLQCHQPGRLTTSHPNAGTGGDLDPTLRWCANITAGSGTLPWSSFNTACWDGFGTPFKNTKGLVSAMILVPGGLTATPFNFCLNALTPR